MLKNIIEFKKSSFPGIGKRTSWTWALVSVTPIDKTEEFKLSTKANDEA